MIKFLGVAQKRSEIVLFFLQKEGENLFFKAAISQDGFEFKETCKYVFALDILQKEEQNYNWDGFRISKLEDQYVLTYSYDGKTDTPLLIAVSTDLSVWYKIGEIENVKETATIVPEFKFKDSHIMYYGTKDIKVAYSEDLLKWRTNDQILLSSRPELFDNSDLGVLNAHQASGNLLLLYYVKKEVNKRLHFSVGAAYFDINNPSKLLWRSEEPIYEYPEEFENDDVKPLGSVIFNNQIILYSVVNGTDIFSVSCPFPTISSVPKKHVFSFLIKKANNNPIISPRPNVPWESRATFNSAAIYEDGKVHFLYRALGDKDLSVLGYATSSDGTNIDYRSDMPAYIPREPFETPGGNKFNSIAAHFVSGGGYGGIEDPRITKIDDKIYLTYVAFDGATPPRVAISNINLDDFLNNNWDKWETPKLISAPGMVNKSAVLFPRKVKDKFVVMHRVYPNILVDYVDDLNFDNYLQGHHFIPPRRNFWDSKKVGAGAPPIETKDGWLLIYQSVGYQDPSRYKIGAMMLDIDNPSKVLYRTHAPIIEPNEDYENNGFKSGVVYPCGGIVMNNKLNIYYGGSDSYLCAASADLDTFLDEMKHNQEPKIKRASGGFYN
jgi:beta-1,2-mannobiose phosphorylase / 1,2-beta-oligomannan phosphorylase